MPVPLEAHPVADRPWGELEWQAASIIKAAQDKYKPVKTFVLFSGGNDSLSMSLVVKRATELDPSIKVDGAVHINTTIGVPETTQFVRDTTRDVLGWPLIEKTPPPGSTYEECVLKWGFPGPDWHRVMYRRLKERGMEAVTREQKGDHVMNKVLYLSGARSQESSRRKKSTGIQDQNRGARVYARPIESWTKAECRGYIRHLGVETNPVVDLLHMSGECLCGAYAQEGELEEIRLWYPHVAERIEELQRKAEAAGVWAKWGSGGPPLWWQESRKCKPLLDFLGEEGGDSDDELCQSCPAKELVTGSE